MDELLHLLPWPAMAVSLVRSWWIGDVQRTFPHLGFAVLLGSNALRVVWAITDRAWALLFMQVAFIFLTWRGFRDSYARRPAREAHDRA